MLRRFIRKYRPRLEALEGRCLPSLTPVLVVPGFGGSLPPSVFDFGTFAVNRGVAPSTLQLDPYDNTYGPLVSALQGAGYTNNQTLFQAVYDWRLPVAPHDTAFDGTITGLTASSMTSGTFTYGVDYLGYWLRQAAETWLQNNPGQPLTQVDVISHSTGNLVTRAYIQSQAYGGTFFDSTLNQTIPLPTIRNFIMAASPNEGASKAWNPMVDNFQGIAGNFTLGLAVALTWGDAYDTVVGMGSAPGTIGGPVPINIASITDPQTAATSAQIFVAQYSPTFNDLLATYNFVNLTQGGTPGNVNLIPQYANYLAQDLNGGVTNGWVSRVQGVFPIYGTAVSTPTTVTRHVGQVSGNDVVYKLENGGPTDVKPGEVWFSDDFVANGGDGTVPLQSLRSTLFGDQAVHTTEFANGDTHATILSDPNALKVMLSELDTQLYAVGAGAGSKPEVKVYDSQSGALKYDLMPYDANFTGGVRVAAGDVNGDGFADIITMAGPGGGADLKVFDGVTGQVIRQAIAFGSFTGGANVAAADVNDDGFADVVVGADAGGGPQIRVFSGKDFSILNDFMPFAVGFTGGVRVAAGDVNGDGFAEIVAGAGAGGGPNVVIYDGKTGAMLSSFFAFDPFFNGGIFLATGDTNFDGDADIIVGAGAGGGPQVNVFDGRDFGLLLSFFAYDVNFTGGVRVASADVNGDGRPDVVTGPGESGGPDIRGYSGFNAALLDQFFAFDPNFFGGVYVGGPGR